MNYDKQWTNAILPFGKLLNRTHPIRLTKVLVICKPDGQWVDVIRFANNQHFC